MAMPSASTKMRAKQLHLPPCPVEVKYYDDFSHCQQIIATAEHNDVWTLHRDGLRVSLDFSVWDNPVRHVLKTLVHRYTEQAYTPDNGYVFPISEICPTRMAIRTNWKSVRRRFATTGTVVERLAYHITPLVP